MIITRFNDVESYSPKLEETYLKLTNSESRNIGHGLPKFDPPAGLTIDEEQFRDIYLYGRPGERRQAYIDGLAELRSMILDSLQRNYERYQTHDLGVPSKTQAAYYHQMTHLHQRMLKLAQRWVEQKGAVASRDEFKRRFQERDYTHAEEDFHRPHEASKLKRGALRASRLVQRWEFRLQELARATNRGGQAV